MTNSFEAFRDFSYLEKNRKIHDLATENIEIPLNEFSIRISVLGVEHDKYIKIGFCLAVLSLYYE